MFRLSVVIITYNEEKNIRRCLESIRELADEIVVVDSLSTDQTVLICKEFGARVIGQSFLGYIEQKNFALAQASNDYVLSLDADEAVSKPLLAAIQQVKAQHFTHDAYHMNRCSNFCGRWIRHGAWYPDRKLRLFNRKKAQWGGINPHDKIDLASGSTSTRLTGDILHYTYYTLEEMVTQMNRFTTIQAEAMYERGNRASLVNLFINPASAFLGGYIMKGGFLDGIDGLIIAKTVAYQTFMKYAKLWRRQRSEKV